jgi:hypothetical protein
MEHPMKLSLFSVEDANRVAQELRPELQRLSRIKREFDQVQSRTDVLRVITAGAAPENPDALDLKRLLERRAQLGDEIARGIQAVHRHGCVLKDLDQGLVDFYALAGDRLVFLCWRMDEPEVAHWHTLTGGFAGRQPLSRLHEAED